MKQKFAAVVLVLAAALACCVPASALPQPQAYQMGALSGVCADGNDLLVTDVYNKVVWRFRDDQASLAAGKIGVADVNGTPIGGYSDGTTENALFTEPWAVVPYLNGFAVTDAESNVVRWFDGKDVKTIAGSGKAGSQNASGTAASFHRPTGLAAGPEGELYVADTGNGSIRRISTKGQVTTWFTGLSEPTGVCWADGGLYVAETGGHCVSRIAGGVRTVVAGTEGTSGSKDGPAESSLLRAPLGVAAGPDGAVYIADTGNSAVRRVRDGRVTTLASGHETPEAPARPRGLLVRGNTLLVTDTLASLVLELPLAGSSYSDMAGSVFAPFAETARERGISYGTGGGRFSPDLPVTRAMFVTMLAGLHRSANGDTVIAGSPVFQDVPSGNMYENSINWCAEQGLVAGDGDRFHPDAPITREDLVAVLYRYAVWSGCSTAANGDLSGFTDGASVSGYARDAVSWAVGAGLLSGNTDGSLDPAGRATRAHAVTILVRFMDAAGL